MRINRINFSDETFWCVYNDGVPSEDRRWPAESSGYRNQTNNLCIETDQLPLSNTVFVRYEIVNTGSVVSNLEGVIFGHAL